MLLLFLNIINNKFTLIPSERKNKRKNYIIFSLKFLLMSR